MNDRAQAGLEYLMTYGWALILVATIITVLVFVVGGEKPGVVFSVSDPAKFVLKSAAVSGNTAGVVLGNATGGKITIKSIAFSGDIAVKIDSKFNGQPAGSVSLPLEILAGGEIRFDGLVAANGGANSGMTIKYTDYANFDREVSVTSGQGAPAGIVAGYSFEEGSGTETAGGIGNKGTVNGAEFQTTSCVSANCLKFVPSQSVVVNSLPAFGDKITVSTWVKFSGWTGDWQSIIHGTTTAGWSTSYWLGYYNGTKLVTFNLQGTTTPRLNVNLPSPLELGKWYHLAGTYDGSNAELYLNGEKIGSPNPTTGVITNQSGLKIGLQGSGTYPLNGFIDEVHIYARALSAGEICSECRRFAAGASVTCSC